jgi:hypothetical protein
MEIHLKIIGCLLIFLSAIHVFFSRYFHWKEDLKPLMLINRQMMYVHAFFIALIVLGIGLLCLLFTSDLINTRLGKSVSLGLALFWGIRLLFQVFIYSSQLWKGKFKETVIHILFTTFWAYCLIVFLAIYLD